jgi:hypothetical protein
MTELEVLYLYLNMKKYDKVIDEINHYNYKMSDDWKKIFKMNMELDNMRSKLDTRFDRYIKKRVR